MTRTPTKQFFKPARVYKKVKADYNGHDSPLCQPTVRGFNGGDGGGIRIDYLSKERNFP
jgi:hypothetical protein